MTSVLTEFPIEDCKDLEDAFNKAAQAQAYTHGWSTVGVAFEQGGRQFVCTSLDVEFLTSLIQRPTVTPRKDLYRYDLANNRNRPLDTEHVTKIKNYLLENQDYILPPILLSASQALRIFRVVSATPTPVAVIAMPHGQFLSVTDGQHRIEALRLAKEERPELKMDAVAVTIVEEKGIVKTHQDFYDAAQTKPLPLSMLIEFDGREPVNRLTVELVQELSIFRDRVNKIGKNIGKKSALMFTNSMIKNAVVMFAIGYQNEEAAGTYLRANPDLWAARIKQFFSIFTGHNPEWSTVAQRPTTSGQPVDMPTYRQKYLHFSGAGLLILGGVGHAINNLSHTDDPQFTEEQEAYIIRLAEEKIDWTKAAPLWRRSVISASNAIVPHMKALQTAVADVKNAIGLPLSESDAKLIHEATEGMKQPQGA